jgi:hypothetical protein
MLGDFRFRIRRSFFVLIGAGSASFLTMMVVQYFMGGIRDVDIALGKAFMIGFGMAVFIFLLPSKQKERYPWQ